MLQSSVTDGQRRYPCPGCGATLLFEPKDGTLTCPYCGRSETIPTTADEVKEHSFDAYLTAQPSQLQALSATAQEVSCKSCGATVAFTPPEVAGECAFCGVAIVMQPKSADPVVAPHAVLPFKVTTADATRAVQDWISSRWFAPNGLKRFAQQQALQGVYLPFWTYDAYTVSHYRGERGDHYYETEHYTETDSSGNQVRKTRQVQKTRWHSASGTVSRGFDDVLVCSTQAVQPAMIAALEPWDLADLKPYDPAFLSGYKAQRYQIDLKAGFDNARQQMASVIDGDVRHSIGGDEQRVHGVSTHYSAVTFKHMLLPVWIGAYRYNGKVYQVLVNARTGEVQGERPYSVWKITFLVLFLLALAYGVYWFANQ